MWSEGSWLHEREIRGLDRAQAPRLNCSAILSSWSFNSQEMNPGGPIYLLPQLENLPPASIPLGGQFICLHDAEKSSSHGSFLLLLIFWVTWPSLLASSQTCGCSSHSCVYSRACISLRSIGAHQLPLLSSCSLCSKSLMTTPRNFEQLQLLLVL